jgi:hypothetical protein
MWDDVVYCRAHWENAHCCCTEFLVLQGIVGGMQWALVKSHTQAPVCLTRERKTLLPEPGLAMQALTSQQASADDVNTMEQGVDLIAQRAGAVRDAGQIASSIAEERKKAYKAVSL